MSPKSIITIAVVIGNVWENPTACGGDESDFESQRSWDEIREVL